MRIPLVAGRSFRPVDHQEERPVVLVVTASGLATGLLGALALAGLLRSLLYGVEPLDPLTFFAVTLLLLAIATLAAWLPARRAARVDPLEALRRH